MTDIFVIAILICKRAIKNGRSEYSERRIRAYLV
jgi:hypothetical protein